MAASLDQDPSVLFQKLVDADSVQRLYGITEKATLNEIKMYVGTEETQWPSISLAYQVDVTRVPLNSSHVGL